jgi:FAD/FMN-containing dehydrogenase
MFVLITLLTVFIYQSITNQMDDELLIHDVSRINSEYVKEIVQDQEEEALKEVILKANEDDLKVSIAGTRHSQGGHSFYKDSVWLDMTEFDEILDFNEKEKTITVQSGVTWQQIQDYINPYGLSVQVMQSSNIFTIGGSLSSNVHGRDPNYGPIIETVKSFRLLLADGTTIDVSRDNNEEIFYLVIGGYGLFGVILDVTLNLTNDEIYLSKSEQINYKEYPAYFEKHISNDRDVGLHFARLSTSSNSFLEEMYMTTYRNLDVNDENYPINEEEYKEITALKEEENIRRDKFFLGLSRNYDWGKSLVWYLQQKLYADAGESEGEVISRNNAMRPPIQFLNYDSSSDTDILQEYFVPTENFPFFVDELRKIVQEENINLFNVTVRYVPARNEGYLTYSNQDTFALVLLINHDLSDEGINHVRKSTQRVVESVLELGGTYYLTYQLYPTQEQIRSAYPNIDSFFNKKIKYDPNELFMNNFYEKYAE